LDAIIHLHIMHHMHFFWRSRISALYWFILAYSNNQTKFYQLCAFTDSAQSWATSSGTFSLGHFWCHVLSDIPVRYGPVHSPVRSDLRSRSGPRRVGPCGPFQISRYGHANSLEKAFLKIKHFFDQFSVNYFWHPFKWTIEIFQDIEHHRMTPIQFDKFIIHVSLTL
jgi:hypothetical protein